MLQIFFQKSSRSSILHWKSKQVWIQTFIYREKLIKYGISKFFSQNETPVKNVL